MAEVKNAFHQEEPVQVEINLDGREYKRPKQRNTSWLTSDKFYTISHWYHHLIPTLLELHALIASDEKKEKTTLH